MTSEWLGEMFEGDSADMCAEKFPLVSMGGQAEGLACADPGARTPIGAENLLVCGFVYNGVIIVILVIVEYILVIIVWFVIFFKILLLSS